jgi:5-methylcytosine-specific restriction enzyme A
MSHYGFNPGSHYYRKDIYRAIGISPSTHGGNWDTGYARYGADFFLFANLGIPGRTGHQYKNCLEGNILHWQAKNGTTVRQPQVRQLLNPPGDIYVFYRTNSRAAFTFAGLGVPVSFEETTPVSINWKIVDYLAEVM